MPHPQVDSASDARPEHLQREYAFRFRESAAYREAVWQALCEGFFARYIDEQSVLLDLGAGWGEFSRNARARQKYAMDLNPDCGARVAGHAQFLHQDCSATWPLADDALDVVFTSNFLEHLPSKALIDKTLAEAFRCLKRGGKIVCLGPNVRHVPGAYWDYWDHHVPITERSMAEALQLQGFRTVEMIDRFLPYTMSDGSQPPLVAVKLYLRLRWAWRLFGKQFLVVAAKP